MPLSLPTGRWGQAAAVALLLMGALLLWSAVASPLLDFYRARQVHLNERHTFADKMAQVAARLPQLKAAVASDRNRVSPPQILIAGDTDALANAQLQQTVEKTAAAAQVTILSADGVPAQDLGAVRRIGLKFALAGQYAGLVALLAAIERATPPLLVDDLQIQGPGGDNDVDPKLLINLTIYAFRAGAKPS